MPLSFRSFKWRCLLSLSLVYSCVPQQHMQTIPSPSASPPVSPQPSFAPSIPPSPTLPSVNPADFRLLNRSEILILRDSGLIEANNAFAWDLFSAIEQAHATEGNTFISPVSASLALQMLLQGARGDTATQLQTALHLASYRPEDFALFLRKLHRPAADVTLELANSLWADEQFTVLPAFQEILQKNFFADAFRVPLQDVKTNTQINQWTAEKTHQAIPQILSPGQPLRADVVALLINAVYFKGEWMYPFETAETEPKPFYLENGTSVDVEMMRRFGQYRYLPPSERFPHQGLTLYYGKDAKVAMYIFLPTTGKNLNDLKNDLQQVGFEALLPDFYTEGGSLQMPRFRMQQAFNLIPALESLGITHVFSEAQADLSGVAESGRLFVNQVDQFTYVEVNEEGTEAAAVTDIEMVTPSSEPLKTLDMRVDHPFFFLIRDEDTGQILFMGSVTDPR